MTASSIDSLQKIRVGIFFGGRSAEHEVSISSAKNVVAALDPNRFTPVLVGIDKVGGWHTVSSPDELALLPDDSVHQKIDSDILASIDVAFPVLHGPYGEDGRMQGVFETAGIPHVGPNVLSSAINMDKDVSKRLLQAANIPVTAFVVAHAHKELPVFEVVAKELGLPLFIKPANMGSSIGVSKVSDKPGFKKALQDAFIYDKKVVIESAVIGDEIECSVFGNQTPKASIIGRIIPNTADFYDYTAKYIDESGAVLEIPARIDESIAHAARQLALEAYSVLECEGLSRVDMFATKDGTILINELNTLPGFTNISMYPKLWEASGVGYGELISQLIEFALERNR